LHVVLPNQYIFYIMADLNSLVHPIELDATSISEKTTVVNDAQDGKIPEKLEEERFSTRDRVLTTEKAVIINGRAKDEEDRPIEASNTQDERRYEMQNVGRNERHHERRSETPDARPRQRHSTGRLSEVEFEIPIGNRTGRVHESSDELSNEMSSLTSAGRHNERPLERSSVSPNEWPGPSSRPRKPEDRRNDRRAERRKDDLYGTGDESLPERRRPQRTGNQRLVVAVDYGTTFSGMPFESPSIPDNMFVKLTIA
jgi:hypothetical protein